MYYVEAVPVGSPQRVTVRILLQPVNRRYGIQSPQAASDLRQERTSVMKP